MDDGRGQWWPEGSGQGRVSAAPQQDVDESDVDRAEQEFRKHVRDCSPCYIDATDCTTAAALRQAWRDAKYRADTP